MFPENPSKLTREDAINQILLSIAMEEYGLSNIINAEGEKIRYVIGTLSGISGPGASVEEVIKVNESVTDLLSQATVAQNALVEKLKAAVASPVLRGPTGPTGPTGAPGESDIRLSLIYVDDYLDLPDEDKRNPKILWVIYPKE